MVKTNYETDTLSYCYKEKYNTLLYIASKKENLEIAKALLSLSEIDVNTLSSKYKWKFSGKASNIDENDINCVKNITIDMDVRIKDEKRKESVKFNTALSIFIENQNIEIIKLLLSNHNINPNFKSICRKWEFSSGYDDFNEYTCEYENTALMASIKKENLDIFKLLLYHPNININETSLYRKSRVFTELFYSKEVNIKEYNSTPLNFSIEKDKLEYFQLLISQPKIDVCRKSIDKYIDIDENRPYKSKQRIIFHDWSFEKVINDIDNKEQYEIIKNAFHIAVNKGNMENIKLILSKPDADININSIYKQNGVELVEHALQIAVIKSDFELFKFLFSRSNVDINKKYVHLYPSSNNNTYREYFSPDINQKNLLHTAVLSNNLEIVKFILSRKDIDINACTSYNKTALHLAASKKHNSDETAIEILKLLVSHPSSDINAKCNSYDKGTALNFAIFSDEIEYVKVLLSHPKIDVNEKIDLNYFSHEDIMSPIIQAVNNGNVEMVRLLLSRQDINIETKYILFDKPNSNCVNREEICILAAALRNKKLDPYSNRNYESYSMFNHEEYIKTINKTIEIVKLLLANPKVDVNEKTIIEKNDGTIIEIPSLYYAIKIENIELLKILLSHPKIDVNSMYIKKLNNDNFYCESALHTAINCTSYSNSENLLKEIIGLLLSHKEIDINAKLIIKNKDKDKNKTVLHSAVKKGYIEVVKCLISNPNINVNETMYSKTSKKEKNGLTALHLAVLKNYSDIVELLLSNPKIDVNIKLNKMEMMKKKEINYYSYNLIDFKLRKKGQRIGMTALHLAVENNNSKIVRILLLNDKIDVNIKLDTFINIEKENNSLYFWRQQALEPRKRIGMTALHLAVESNNSEIVRILLSNKKIDVNIKLDTFMDYVEEAPNHHLLFSFCPAEKPKIRKEMTALHTAIENNNSEILKILLSNKKIDLNTPMLFDVYQFTPLHLACALKYKTIVDELFLKGAYFC